MGSPDKEALDEAFAQLEDNRRVVGQSAGSSRAASASTAGATPEKWRPQPRRQARARGGGSAHSVGLITRAAVSGRLGTGGVPQLSPT